MMYLVVLHYWRSNHDEPCVTCKTREKAQEYINNVINDYQYNGEAHYQIREVEIYV